jgi:hypothetical protein
MYTSMPFALPPNASDWRGTSKLFAIVCVRLCETRQFAVTWFEGKFDLLQLAAMTLRQARFSGVG